METELADMWPELAGAWEPVKKQNPMHKELLKSALHRELRTQTSNKRWRLDLATIGRLAPYLQDSTSSSGDSDYGDD